MTTRGVLDWLAYCFCGYAVYLLGWTIWKKERPKHAERWMRWIASIRKAKGKVDQGFVFLSSMNGAMVLSIIFIAGLVVGAARMGDYTVAEEHNVSVVKALGNNEWRMHSDEEGDFVYRGCPDFDNASVIWVGYIADRAKWKEYGRCKSIRDTGFGFWWRQGHDDYRRIN